MFNLLLTRAPDDMIMYPVGSVYLIVREIQMQVAGQTTIITMVGRNPENHETSDVIHETSGQ